MHLLHNCKPFIVNEYAISTELLLTIMQKLHIFNHVKQRYKKHDRRIIIS